MDNIKRCIPRLDGILSAVFVCIALNGIFSLLEGCFGIFKLLTDQEAALSGYMELSSGFLELSSKTGFGISFRTAMTMNLVRCVSAVLTATALCLGIRSLRRILNYLSFGLPFHAQVADELHGMALLSAVYCIIDAFLRFVTNITLSRGYNIEAFLTNGEPLTVAFNDLPYYPNLILVIVLYFLSWIFRYGEELQQLSDETL